MSTEPTLADVLASIERLSTETRTRHESLASESRARDVEQTERSVRLEAKVEDSVRGLTSGMTTLHEDVATLKSLVPKVERTATEAAAQARSAMASHHGLEEASQTHWRTVMERLDKQDNDRDRIEREKKEAREQAEIQRRQQLEQESIAAKRLATTKEQEAALAASKKEQDARIAAEKEKTRTERQKIYITAAQTVFVAAVTSCGGYFAVRAAHQDTDAKIDAQSRQLSAVSKRVETVVGVVAPASEPNSSSAAASAPESPASIPAPPPAAPAAPPPRPPGRNAH